MKAAEREEGKSSRLERCLNGFIYKGICDPFPGRVLILGVRQKKKSRVCQQVLRNYYVTHKPCCETASRYRNKNTSFCSRDFSSESFGGMILYQFTSPKNRNMCLVRLVVHDLQEDIISSLSLWKTQTPSIDSVILKDGLKLS